jgi:hypothetical protein
VVIHGGFTIDLSKFTQSAASNDDPTTVTRSDVKEGVIDLAAEG